MEPNMTGNEDYGPKKRGGGGPQTPTTVTESSTVI